MVIERSTLTEVAAGLADAPAVVLIGPRQVGKTTLSLDLAETRPSVYVDLESSTGLARLHDPAAFLEHHSTKLVILDEVHRLPGLFVELRGVIDANRRAGHRTGQFLLLGSASLDLLHQSSESLAGRTRIIEMPPVTAAEVQPDELSAWWLRGGFPDSLLARSDRASLRWRRDFIRTYLERDIPQLGPRIPAERLRRLWTMLAHQQGGLSNAASLARSLGVDAKTVATYLDLFVDLLLVRRLEPWHANTGKRLVRSPKLYIRDAGIVHALLGIETLDALRGHPVAGGSWEGAAIESLINHAPDGSEFRFYRSAAGAEIDLVIVPPDGREPWAIEVKLSTAPRPTRGFHTAADDIDTERRYIVHPGPDTFPLGNDVTAIRLRDMCRLLTESDAQPNRGG